MSWRHIRIGDFGRVVTGRTPPSTLPHLFGDVYPFITPTDIDGQERRVQPERFLSEAGKESMERVLVPPGSIAYVCIASVGKVCVVDRPSFTNQQINTVIVERASHDPAFVYYALRDATPRIKAMAGGAATPIINKSTFSEITVRAPELSVQARIGSILSAYDDLIENNTQRITILEGLARRIYEEWFVRFRFPGHEVVRMVESEHGSVPEGWEVTTLGLVAENHDRFRKPLSKMQRENFKGPYPYYGAAKVFDYVREYLFDGQFLLLAEDGSVETPDGYPVLQLTDGRFWANNHTHILRGSEKASTEYLYLRLERQPIRGYITGAAQPKLTQANINRIPVLLPPAVVMQHFNLMVEPLFKLRASLVRKNTILRTTRDLLLPKLISGELAVSEFPEPETAAA